jgi:hypothetical protein
MMSASAARSRRGSGVDPRRSRRGRPDRGSGFGIDIPLVFLIGSGFEQDGPVGQAGRDAIRFTQGPAGRSLRTAPDSRS